MMDNQINNELIDFLKVLLDREELSGSINGIAKQIITRGTDSMSAKQRTVVEDFIESYKSKNECERCINDNVSSLTDYIEIADDGLCPTCQYDQEKLMRD